MDRASWCYRFLVLHCCFADLSCSIDNTLYAIKVDDFTLEELMMYSKAMWEHPSPFKLIRNSLISQINVLDLGQLP